MLSLPLGPPNFIHNTPRSKIQNALAEPTQPARLPPLGRADPTCSTATSRSLCAARDRKQQKDLINTLKAKAQCLVNTLTRKLKKILCIPRVRRAAQALGPGDCNAHAKSLGIMVWAMKPAPGDVPGEFTLFGRVMQGLVYPSQRPGDHFQVDFVAAAIYLLDSGRRRDFTLGCRPL
ncbi:hypothetical protein PTTG_26592 [Puccinia triticina 1-1 BBBD Race 1]|uniref:Uncharacterized protein n=1 Tax=Puccinia triticina (isolate 1-1 / race 1 (BBBD)) TaxID=630390 RepID=A0A180GS89_PUCT1|nr:hypothetical protein PTTG_26592 [Puccinia triticina 1-1 BBBD Race 1]